jgi:multisubunit Na+/H+ antiporter MnhF subunit
MDIEAVFVVILTLLSLGGLVRVLEGPTVWDRLMGFALFSSKVIIIVILLGFLIDKSYMIDVALVYGVLGFIGTIMIARFIERRGDI